MTVCSGELKFAAEQTSPVAAAASAHAAATASGASPMTAAIAPCPTGTASCMKRPRRLTSTTASSSVSAPAATRAAYSPSEWPAATEGATPLAFRTSKTATECVRMAGCVTAVCLRSSSLPSKEVFEIDRPRGASAASARSYTRFASGKASARSFPMPANCEPCPGKRKARLTAFTIGRARHPR